MHIFDLQKKEFNALLACLIKVYIWLWLRQWAAVVDHIFSAFYLFILSARWWEMKDWNLTIAVQSSAFWILNKMMNQFAQASTDAGFALRNMGERESKLCECSWTKSLIIFLSVEILFVWIGFCCYRGSMRNRFLPHPAHLTLRGRGS